MFSSVKARILMILMAMSVLSGAAIVVGLIAFNSIQQQFETITAERVPEIASTTELIVDTGELTSRLMQLNHSADVEQLEVSEAAATAQMETVRHEIDALSGDVGPEMSELLAKVEADIAALGAKRREEFTAAARLNDTMTELTRLGALATEQLAPLVDDAIFDLQIGGTGTIESVDSTLSNLVEEQFQAVSEILQIRAEINLLAGVSLSRSVIRDAGSIAILTDIGTSSSEALMALLPNLEGVELLESYLPEIREVAEFYQGVFATERQTGAEMRNEYLARRQQADTVLSGAIDDLVFDLTIGAADAAEQNGVAIQDLLDVQVNSIREMLVLDSAFQEFIASAIAATIHDNNEALDRAQGQLDMARQRLEQSLKTDDVVVRETAGFLMAVADPETGVVAQKKAVVQAEIDGIEISSAAIENVHMVAHQASALGLAALDRVRQSGDELSGEMTAAKSTMFAITGVTLAVLVGAVFLTQRILIAPLSRLTGATERLATGDMSEIEGVDTRDNELGRMGRALSVFRENSLKVEELNEKTKAREAEEKRNRQAMFRMLSQEIGSVVTAASAGDFSKRVEKEFEDPEIAKLGTDLNSLMDVTEEGLNETRAALKAMSEADLTHRMPSHFRGVFGDLAHDVNSTLSHLSSLIGNMRDAAAMTSESAAKLSDGAEQLATRAEHQAATLEETAAAMTEMSESVKSSSGSLSDAETLSGEVAQKTASGSSAAAIAVENVQQIKESSNKIHEIISVIENISFQTNLLALNAAVEAARAGEAGKGFAVVASEVRGLAQRSNEAAREISDLIRESTERVETGVRSVEAARTSFQEIDSSVRPVIELLSQIAEAGREQAIGISEVATAVSTMDTMTQENARMAEMSTSMAGGLLGQIRSLSEMAAAFRVAESGPVLEAVDDQDGFDGGDFSEEYAA